MSRERHVMRPHYMSRERHVMRPHETCNEACNETCNEACHLLESCKESRNLSNLLQSIDL